MSITDHIEKTVRQARIMELEIVLRRANGLMESPQLKNFIKKRIQELTKKGV